MFYSSLYGLKSSKFVSVFTFIKRSVSYQNEKHRVMLAAAHRGLYEAKLTDRVYNHASAKFVDDNKRDRILITPYPINFNEVTPNNLLEITREGRLLEGKKELHDVTRSFHLGIYKHVPEASCILHTHSTFVCIIASLEVDEIKPLHQSFFWIKPSIAKKSYNGFVNNQSEGERIGIMVKEDNCNALILPNHGSVVIGRTIAEAFNRALLLEWSCKIQVYAMTMRLPMRTISAEVLEMGRNTIEKRMREDPSFETEHLNSLIRKYNYSKFE